MLKATRYTIGSHLRHDAIDVEERDERIDSWAIKSDHLVWTRDGEWEHEPMPSSRDKAFLERARWTEREAIGEAIRIYDAGLHKSDVT